MENIPYELSLLKIPVSDIGRSAAFYRDELGMELLFAADAYGWAQLQAGAVPLALYKPGKGGGDGKIGGSTGFHLSVPPERFNDLADRFLQTNLLVENRIHRGDDGSTSIEVIDPDGNTIRIMRGAAQ